MTFYEEDRYQNNAILAFTQKTEDAYRTRYERIASNIFEWDGLPDGIPSEVLELALARSNVMIYDSSEIGITVAKAEIRGYDTLNRPKVVRPIFINGAYPYSSWERPELINGESAVFLSDLTDWKKSRMDYIREAGLIKRMTEIDIAISQQVINQRAPLMLTSDSKLASKKGSIFVREMLNGCDVYIGEPGIDKMLTALKLDSSYNVESLLQVRKAYFNEGLEILGVNNEPAMQKRERMNNIEVESNDELLNVYLRDALNVRKKACDRINSLFGLTATVDTIENVRISQSDEVDEVDEEGDIDDENNA